MTRLLNGTLALGNPRQGGISDVEAFCRHILNEVLRANGGWLNPDHYDDALTALIELAWKLDRKYDPRRSDQSLRAYVGWIAKRRTTDWYRATFYGRRADKELPVSLSDYLDQDDHTDRGLDRALTVPAGVHGGDRDAALLRLDVPSGRAKVGNVRVLREALTRDSETRAA